MLTSETYQELYRVAQRALAGERPDQTLQATALVHEAYLRLSSQRNLDPGNREQFLALASRMMRRILIDAARRRQRRGGRVTMTDELGESENSDITDVIALHEALEKLESLDVRKSRLVEMRLFGGLTIDEIAEILKVSPRTAASDWSFARAWLRREIRGQE